MVVVDVDHPDIEKFINWKVVEEQKVAALVAGAVIYRTGWMPIDPILSLVVALLILRSTLALLKESTGVLLEGVPGHVSYEAVGRALAAIPGVTRAAPMVRGQVMVTAFDQSTGGDVYGMTLDDLASLPRIGAGNLGQAAPCQL